MIASGGATKAPMLITRFQQLITPGSLHARFTRGVFWSLLGAIFSRSLTLAAAVACARILGKISYGELGIIQSTAGTFGIFAGLGLGLTATKFIAELREQDPARAGRILALSAVIAVVSGTVTAALLIVLSPYLSRHTLAAPQLSRPLMIGAGLVFFGALNGAQTGALGGFEAFRTIAKVNLVAGLLSFPFVFIGVWRWGLSGAVWGMVAALGVNWLLNNYALRQQCARFKVFYDFAGCTKEWPILHQFSLPAFLASIVVGPALWISSAFLVRQADGYSQLGLYTAADRWRLMVLFVPTSVFGMLVPVLSNLYGAGDLLGFRKVFRINVIGLCGLALLGALAVTAAAKPIMSMYGPAFQPGWPILIILSLAAVPEALNTLLGHPLIVANAMWWRFAFDMLLAVVLVLMSFLLIPRWGALGLASAYCTAFCAVSLGLYLFGTVKARSMFAEERMNQEQDLYTPLNGELSNSRSPHAHPVVSQSEKVIFAKQ